jgi:hypothetical protein
MGFETFMQIASGGESTDESLFPKDESGNLLNAYVTDINDPRGIGYLSPGSYMGGPGETWHPSQYDFSGLSLAGSQDGKATFQDENGLTFKYDYRTDTVEGIDPNTARDLKQSNPDAYYGELATQLKNDYFDSWKVGHAQESYNEKLEDIKDVSPKAYYQAKLNLLGQQAGWYQGQNTTGGIAPLMKQAEELAPEAYKYGVAPEQMTSLVNQGFSAANRENATRIANEASRGGAFIKPSDWVTIASILGGGALAAYTAPAAGAAAAAEGAGAIGSTALSEAAPLTTAQILGSSFSGSNFAIDPLATYAAGLAATEAAPLTTSNILNSGFTGSDFAIDPLATYAPGLSSETAPLTTNEILKSTGFNPTEGSSFTIDPNAAYTTGANSISDATKLPEYSASDSTNLKDVAKTLNQARQVNSAANNIAKLLTGGTTAKTGVTGTTGSTTASQLASLLAPAAQTNNFIGQYKMNQNPFTFTSAGQTAASPGMYDVSGSNLANALRKA